MKKYLIVDYYRGWSVFTIALMHLLTGSVAGVLSKAAAFGGAGVHVFILCSGFGLYLSYLRKPLGYSNFLKRRFTKVWIPYAIAVLLWGTWFLVSKGFFPFREVSSHLLLYKMFSIELDTSLCYPYWFISTIMQFYLFWPLIVKVFRMRWGGQLLIITNLLWSTLVGLLGLEEARPWGSFFLQYLWEFALGMWIAEKCTETTGLGERLMDIKTYKWWWLVLGAAGGMGLSAIMAWNGGVLQLYNDIPSLVGYLSVALLVYKCGIKMVSRFFEWASGFSYELYLLHSLVFTVIAYMFADKITTYLVLIVSFIAAYTLAYLYGWLTKRIVLI